jgi:mannose-1-phosphate guanylyltransferase
MLEGKVHDVSYPAPWIADGAAVDLRAHLGRWVAVGEGASIGPEAQVDDSVLHADVAIAAGARIAGSIIAKAATVGEGATVIDSVIGEGASVPAGLTLEAARVAAGAIA